MSAGGAYDRYRVLDGNVREINDSSSFPLNYSSNVNGDFYWNKENGITQYISN